MADGGQAGVALASPRADPHQPLEYEVERLVERFCRLGMPRGANTCEHLNEPRIGGRSSRPTEDAICALGLVSPGGRNKGEWVGYGKSRGCQRIDLSVLPAERPRLAGIG